MNNIVDAEGRALERMPPQQDKPLQAISATPSDLLKLAVEQGADLDRLERLMALQERWQANQARMAYVEAMAEFKKNPPKIFKDKHVSFQTSKGTTSYDHATIGNVTTVLTAALAEHGFTHKWEPEQPEGGMIVVSCILTHSQGHSERTTLRAGKDDSGGKNSIQQVSSTVTYLERYTLLAACGMATHDQPDDDGNGAGEHQKDEQAQAEEVQRQNDMRRSAFVLAMGRLHDSILVVRENLKVGKLDAAAEAWFELSDDEKRSIWIAPKTCKEWGVDAPFSTAEREIIKSTEFRKAYYGEDNAA